ncbi:unnamed protein product, partial [Lymnaea stagnalis]
TALHIRSSSTALLSSTLATLHRKHASLGSAAHPTPQAYKKDTWGCDIDVELLELPTPQKTLAGPLKEVKSFAGSPSTPVKPGPTPFNKSSLECSDSKSWRPVRPKSVEVIQRTVSTSEYETGSDKSRGRKSAGLYGGLPDAQEEEASLRHISEEGRKIRRLHGNSHPLTKLSE